MHPVEFTTMIHDLGDYRILTELMYERRDHRVDDECFGGDAAVPELTQRR